MPLLDDDQVNELREWRGHCPQCHQEIRRNYCRQCDEFYYYGHLRDCFSFDPTHLPHRTY